MQINTSREIGILVRERRRAERISQHVLADLVGASRQWIQRLEAGKPGIELGLTLRALAALGIRLDARTAGDPVPRHQERALPSIDINAIVAPKALLPKKKA